MSTTLRTPECRTGAATRRIAWLAAIALLAALTAEAANPVRARRAMVVTREPHATAVGRQVLAAGGNAVDAAVAVGFALAVTHPAAGNLGGGGFMLIRLRDGTTTFLDFREMAPAAATRDMYLDSRGEQTEDSLTGWRASGVPGTVAGLELAARRYGTKKWADLLAPAIELAAQGFEVPYHLAESLRSTAKLALFPESRRIFLNNGRYFEPGDTLRQPDLARTLSLIAEGGAREFYEGSIARRLALEMTAHGGTIAAEDMRNYRAVEREPLQGAYRGLGIVTAPPPSSGGAGLLQMLGVLEGSDYARHGAGSAAAIHYVVETMRRFYADRSEFLADPDFADVPFRRLLDPGYIARLRGSIDTGRATPSEQVRPGVLGPIESSETTHYSVVDAQGNAVAVTYTINGSYGSGVTIPGLGFLMNNEMNDFSTKPGEPNLFGLIQGERNAIAPRKRPLSSMTPTILVKDGRAYMVVGSPGGATIINTVLQVILNVVDFSLNIQDAVDRPRFHHQWMPDRIEMETGFSPDTVALLESRGHRVQAGRTLGEVSAILVDGGWLQGAADSRYYGAAEGY